MSVIRLPLLCAFVGGCLSSAVVFGLWQADHEAPAPQSAMRKVEVLAPARPPSQPEAPQPIVDRVVEPGPSAPSEAAVAQNAQDAKGAQDTDSNSAAVPAGSAVSDVLTRLEAEYRQRVAAVTAPPATVVPASTVVPVAVVPAAVVPAALSQVAAIAPAAALAPVVSITPAPAVPAPASPVAVAPQAAPVAQAAVVQAAVAAAPAYAVQNDPRPRDVHIGDVTQNTYITNVRQGDVYLMQMQQQIAMLQYMQLLGMQGAGGAALPVRQVRAVAPQRFTSGITNPDNPWGFNFAPPNLVR